MHGVYVFVVSLCMRVNCWALTKKTSSLTVLPDSNSVPMKLPLNSLAFLESAKLPVGAMPETNTVKLLQSL